MANQAKLRSFRTAPKYMYGYEIPKHYADALRLDRLHGNTKWQDATKAEMDQLAEYKVFVDMRLGTPIPKGYQKIRVHLVFACKHDGMHNVVGRLLLAPAKYRTESLDRHEGVTAIPRPKV